MDIERNTSRDAERRSQTPRLPSRQPACDSAFGRCSAPPSFDQKSAVIIIEIADSDIHWMEPRDVLLGELSMKINDRSNPSVSSYHGGAVHADGSVETLEDATTEERVRELLTQ